MFSLLKRYKFHLKNTFLINSHNLSLFLPGNTAHEDDDDIFEVGNISPQDIRVIADRKNSTQKSKLSKQVSSFISNGNEVF